MLGYFKRAGDSSTDAKGDGGAAASKRPRIDGEETASRRGEAPPMAVHARGDVDPSMIVTWNANGLGVRLNKDWVDFERFIESTRPDVCCIQEARLAALGPPKCKKDDDRGRKRGQLKVDTAADRKDSDLLETKLNPLARRLGYRVILSLANYKYAGSAALIRKTCTPSNIFYNITPDGLSREHHREGRVIALEEKWDANLRAFVDAYDKPLVIIGDLNVAHEDADLTHPLYFKRMCPADNPKNSGQPGCTPAERERHSQLLACGGGLIDAYRHLHPANSSTDRELEPTDTPGITWRGTAGNSIAAAGRFYGKGMRIDYFLTSKVLGPRVAEVNVFGYGADREGFLGSDHSPLMLTLRRPEEEGNTACSDGE